ncbi:MAG TPA: response regulator, partial [Anaerolineae bacterium]|nr:response regulator [Anaerolineae bacterium]
MPPIDAPADILLVDDNPANLRLLSQILAERGHRVRAVTSGPRALASARMHAPDLVLLDIRMPDMDGYQVCRQLK